MADKTKANPASTSAVRQKPSGKPLKPKAARRPDEDSPSTTTIFAQNSVQEFTTGDLPPPSMMAGYAEILPDAPERLFAEFERNGRVRRLRRLAPFILIPMVLATAFGVAYVTGSPWGGAAIVASAFGYGVAGLLADTSRRRKS